MASRKEKARRATASGRANSTPRPYEPTCLVCDGTGHSTDECPHGDGLEPEGED